MNQSKIPISFHQFKKNPISIASRLDFLCGETSSDPFGECFFSAYEKEIEKDWDQDSIFIIPGNEEYALADNGYNCFLLHTDPDGPWEMVGFYAGPTICIHPNHQNQGFGTELILYTACVREGPPTADYDKQMFSAGGFKAHCSAYQLGLERGWIVSSPEKSHIRKNSYIIGNMQIGE
ncbi:MAG TPA: hypothetical protein VIY47_17105 [Ignavibacteriaceae bacterium]